MFLFSTNDFALYIALMALATEFGLNLKSR